MQRLWRHLLFFPWRLRQQFTQPVLQAIELAIKDSETRHSGQIRVTVEANLSLISLLRGVTSRSRAQELFTQLRVWDTEQNNGVLIYLLLAEHRVEIVADRGFQTIVTPPMWQGICEHIQQGLRQGDFEVAVCTGIRDMDALLASHFPLTEARSNELPDRPVVL